MAFAGDLLRDNTTNYASNFKGTGTFFRHDGPSLQRRHCRSPRKLMTKVCRLHLVVLLVSPYFERNSGPDHHQLTTKVLKVSATYLLLFNAQRFCSVPTSITQCVTIPLRHTFHHSPSLLHSSILKCNSWLRGHFLVDRAQRNWSRSDSRWMQVDLRIS